MIDRIHIEQLELMARIGVPQAERAQPQRLVLNITLWPRSGRIRDDIAATINYSSVADEVRQFVANQEYRLIETLAEQLGLTILGRFKARKVAVEVRKFVIADAAYVSVTAISQQRTRK